MLQSRTIAGFIAVLTLVAALVVVVDRGGLLAWSALFLGAALFAKIWRKPSKRDLMLSIGLATFSILAWVGVLYYVISTYESGEVVELAIDTKNGTHTARLWVLEVGPDPVVYYDAEPQIAESLLAGKPLQFTRGGEVSIRKPEAKPIDALSEADASQLLEAMENKYGNRTLAYEVYYLMLGVPRDRISVVASLVKE